MVHTDLAYALKQLREISLKSLNQAGQYGAVDRLTRALDALSRLEAEQLQPDIPAEDRIICRPLNDI